MLNTRRYLITVTDAESREVIIFTGTDWTAERANSHRNDFGASWSAGRQGQGCPASAQESQGLAAGPDIFIGKQRTRRMARWPGGRFNNLSGFSCEKKRLSQGHNAAVWTTMKSGKPIILVVEDEVLVRMMAVRVAEDNGFESLSAASADEAIMILESRTDIRLVFTDVNMPGSMDGLRLAYAVRGRWPPVEILVTSALSNLTAKDLPERGRFLLKPYDDATLSKAFQQMAGD